MAAQLPKLIGVSLTAHTADQLALAAVPLALAASGASAGTISLLVAAQSAAWLLVSLPAGALADRMSRKWIMSLGALAIMIGSALAALGLDSQSRSDLLLGAGVLIAASGVVLQVLSIFAVLPGLVTRDRIAPSNALLEFVRASVVIVAPVVVAASIEAGRGDLAFVIGAIAGAMGLVLVATLPADQPASGARQPLMRSVRDGAVFVADTPILRAIALCAVFWNFAFFALTAVFAPYALRVLQFTAPDVGRLWAIYGAGLLLGALSAPSLLRRVRTGWLFVLGPASSFCGVAAVALFAQEGSFRVAAIGFFSLGFGPMIWLVLQTSVRQLLTPPDYLGRVAATITTAIYGIRPLGALGAGAVAQWVSYEAAIWLAAASFFLSILAILASPASRLIGMPNPVGADASRSV
jgi:predicted MFS family arabinose efflux permease